MSVSRGSRATLVDRQLPLWLSFATRMACRFGADETNTPGHVWPRDKDRTIGVGVEVGNGARGGRNAAMLVVVRTPGERGRAMSLRCDVDFRAHSRVHSGRRPPLREMRAIGAAKFEIFSTTKLMITRFCDVRLI